MRKKMGAVEGVPISQRRLPTMTARRTKFDAFCLL
jgi:hypothetical protein